MEDLVALLHRELAGQSSIRRRRGGPAAASFPSAREQGGVGVGHRDVERREGGPRRPGCSAEPRNRGRRERRGIRWRARETERARRKYLGGAGGEKKRSKGKRRGKGRDRGRRTDRSDRKVEKLTVTRIFIIAGSTAARARAIGGGGALCWGSQVGHGVMQVRVCGLMGRLGPGATKFFFMDTPKSVTFAG
jgi:hypothetical protein